MITTEIKKQIIEAIKANEKEHQSAARFAVTLGINPAQLSQIKNGKTERVLSDAKWATIARRLGISIGAAIELNTAQTPTFVSINRQLQACQQLSVSGLLCDIADIGKTYAAKYYVKHNKSAIYVDCSLHKSKQQLVRQIAKEFGVGHTFRYKEVFADLVYFLQALPNPLIILDEAGDLSYEAFLELKALWNATETFCGWYMMGADGLRDKIERNLNRRKVGYAEIFSRFGSRFQRFTPEGGEARKSFIYNHVELIGKANGFTDIKQLYVNTQGSLRRIRTELKKLNATR